MKKRITSMLMTAIMVLACATPASASFRTDAAGDDFLSERNIPIGTPADEDGILLEDASTRASGLPFSMRAASVKNLLTTYHSSGKNFSGTDFGTGEGLKIVGTLNSTYAGANIKVGACSYVIATDTFYSVSPRYFDSGVATTAWIPKMAEKVVLFENSQTYYGFISNYIGEGTVSGTLNYSVSRNPF